MKKSTPRVRPLLRWPGGKSRMLKHLLPLIPAHTCYCEPFAGGLAVLLAKPRSPVEVVNDLNGDLIALYLNVQRHLPEVLRQIEMVVSSRQLLHLFTQQQGMTDLERAVRYFVRNRTSFGGGMRSYAVAKTSGGGAGFVREKNMDLIRHVHERLDGVAIENIPYDRCLKNYDSKDTFFFMDPPYTVGETNNYAAWGEPEVKQLRRQVDALQGRWMITLNDSPANRAAFAGCQIQSVVSKSGCVNKRTHSEKSFAEIIITP